MLISVLVTDSFSVERRVSIPRTVYYRVHAMRPSISFTRISIASLLSDHHDQVLLFSPHQNICPAAFAAAKTGPLRILSSRQSSYCQEYYTRLPVATANSASLGPRELSRKLHRAMPTSAAFGVRDASTPVAMCIRPCLTS